MPVSSEDLQSYLSESQNPNVAARRAWLASDQVEPWEDYYLRPDVQAAVADKELQLSSPDLNIAQEFTRGVKRGVVRNTAGTFAEIANFAARNLGMDKAEELSQTALDTLDKLYESPELRQSYEAATGDWKNLNHLLSATGEGATSVAAIVASGGAGALAKGGLKALVKSQARKAIKNKIKTASVKRQLTKLASNFIPGAALSSQLAGSAMMGAEQAGDIRQYEARTGEDVGTMAELATVLPNAIIGGYLEKLVPGLMVNKPLSALAKIRLGKEIGQDLTERGFKKWLTATGKTAAEGSAGEFATEYAQSVLSNSLAKAGYDVDRDVLAGAFESGLIGGLIGGGMGTVSGGASEAIRQSVPIDGLDQKLQDTGQKVAESPVSPTTTASSVQPKFEGPLDSRKDPEITPNQILENETVQAAALQNELSKEDQIMQEVLGAEAFQELSGREAAREQEDTARQAEAERVPRQFVKEEGILQGVEKSKDDILFAPGTPEALKENRDQIFEDRTSWDNLNPDQKALFKGKVDYNKSILQYNRAKANKKASPVKASRKEQLIKKAREKSDSLKGVNVKNVPMSYRVGEKSGWNLREEHKGKGFKKIADLIPSGLRTATTRAKHKLVPVGQTLTFRGVPGIYRVTKHVQLKPGKNTIEEWSKREGWAPEAFNKFGNQVKYGAWQMIYERIDNKEQNEETKVKALIKAKEKNPKKATLKEDKFRIVNLKTADDVLQHYGKLSDLQNIKTIPLRNKFYRLLANKGITNATLFKEAKGKLTPFTPTKISAEEFSKMSGKEKLSHLGTQFSEVAKKGGKPLPFTPTQNGLQFGSPEELSKMVGKDQVLQPDSFLTKAATQTFIKKTASIPNTSEIVVEKVEGKQDKFKIVSPKPLKNSVSITEVGKYEARDIKKAAQKFFSNLFRTKPVDSFKDSDSISVAPIIEKIVANRQKTVRLAFAEKDAYNDKGSLGTSDLSGGQAETPYKESQAIAKQLNSSLAERELSDYEAAIRQFNQLEREIEVALQNKSLSAEDILQTLRGFTKKNRKEATATKKYVKDIKQSINENLQIIKGNNPETLDEAIANLQFYKNSLEEAFAVHPEASGDLSSLLYGSTGKALKSYISQRISGEVTLTLPQIRGLQSVTSTFGKQVALGKTAKLGELEGHYAKRTKDYWHENPEFITQTRIGWSLLEFTSPKHTFKSYEEYFNNEVQARVDEANEGIQRYFKQLKNIKIHYPRGLKSSLMGLDSTISGLGSTLTKLANLGKDLTVTQQIKWEKTLNDLEIAETKRSKILTNWLKSKDTDPAEVTQYLSDTAKQQAVQGSKDISALTIRSLPMSSQDILERSDRDIERFLSEPGGRTQYDKSTSKPFMMFPKFGEGLNGAPTTVTPPIAQRVASDLKLTKAQQEVFGSPLGLMKTAAYAHLKKSYGQKLSEKDLTALKIANFKVVGMKNALASITSDVIHGEVSVEARDIRDSGEISSATVLFDRLNKAVAEGQNVREFIESMDADLSKYPATAQVYKLLKALIREANGAELDTLRMAPTNQHRAFYQNGAINIPAGTTNLYEFTHEVLHGLTSHKIRNNAEGTNELKRVYDLAKRASIGFQDPVSRVLYALNQENDLAGLEEFAAELYLNPYLQNFMKSVKDPGQPKQTLWQKFIGIMNKILGFKQDDSLLTSAMNAAATIIKQDSSSVASLNSKVSYAPSTANESLTAESTPEPDSDTSVSFLVERNGFTEEEARAIMSDPHMSERANQMIISELGMEAFQETAGKKLSPDEQKLLNRTKEQKYQSELTKQERLTDNRKISKEIYNHLDIQPDYKGTLKQKIGRIVGNINSWTLSMSNIIDTITNFSEEGGKSLKELFIRRVSDSENAKSNFIHLRESNFDNIIKKYGFDREEMESQKLEVSASYTNREGDYVPAKKVKLWNALLVYATRGNPEFQKALAANTEGRKLSNIQKEAKFLTKNLSEGHKFLADVMQRDLAKQAGMVAEKISELEDTYVLRNDGKPISEKLQKQLDEIMEGYGYFKDTKSYMPILGRHISSREDMLGDIAQALQIAPEGRKRIKKDTDLGTKGINQNLFHVWQQTTRNQAHFLSYADVIHDMWDTLRGGETNERLDKLIFDKFGSQTIDAFEAYVHSVAKPTEHLAQDGVAKIARKVRGAAALSFLGWNIMTMAKQVPSVVYFLAKVQPSFMLRTLSQMTSKDGIKAVLDFAKTEPQMRDRQMEQVLDELNSIDTGVYERYLGKALALTPGLSNAKALKIKKKTFQSLMAGIRVADQVVTSIGFYAKYQQGIKEGKSESDARYEALQTVLTSQPASNVKDVGRLWRHSSVLSTFLMFTNQLSKIYNMGVHDVLLKGIAQKGFDKDMARTSIALAAGALGIGIISHGFRWEDDDEETGFIREGVNMLGGGIVAPIPFIGGSLAAAWNGWPAPSDLARTIPYEALRTGQLLVKGEFGKATKSALRTTLLPGQAQMQRVWQAFDSDTPEYGITRLAGAKRVFDTEESLIPIMQEYKKALSWEQSNQTEVRQILSEVRRLKRKAANAGKRGDAASAAKFRRQATELKKGLTASKWKNKIESLTKKWSLDRDKVNQMMRSL